MPPAASSRLKLTLNASPGGGSPPQSGCCHRILPAKRAHFTPASLALRPLETPALGPLWIAATDAADVTELLYRRTFAADAVVILLHGALPAAPGPIAEALGTHDGLVLEDVLYRLSDSGGGIIGQTQLDLLLDGTTLYPSFAQDDHRPAWPFDTATLIVQGRIHELTELHPGQLLQLVSIEHPKGGTPARAEAYLLCRRS